MRPSRPRPAAPQKPLVEVAILGDDDAHLPAGETRRDRHPHRGQHQLLLAQPRSDRGAVHAPTAIVRTGDIGYLDEDGYLFIVDRKKEIIIRGGENISAAEVEAECYACPAVAEVAVFGAPDERLGEVPVAVVHVKDGERLDEDELRAFLDGRLAKFKIPERIIFSDEPLPRLGTGKIDRRALKAQYAH